MRNLIIILCLLYNSTLFARELHFIESKLIRLSAYKNVEEWIIPFYRDQTIHKGNFTTFISTNPDTFNTLRDFKNNIKQRVDSKDQSIFGSPYNFKGKLLIGFNQKNVFNTFSYNTGASFIVNDPIFPELSGIFYRDFTLTSSRTIKSKNYEFTPQVIFGARQIVDTTFTLIDYLNNKSKYDPNNTPLEPFLDIGFKSIHYFDYFNFNFEVNSIPVINNEIQYWNSVLGLKTKNLNKNLTNIFKKIDTYISFSPIYSGSYEMNKTLQVGMGVEFNDHFFFDLFLERQNSLGGIIKINLKNYELSLYSNEQIEHNEIKSRQFGIKNEIKF